MNALERLCLGKLGIILHLSELSTLSVSWVMWMGAHKAQQVIGCFSWKSSKRIFVGIYRKKTRKNGNGCWVIISVHILLRCLWDLNPYWHFARVVSVLNVKFKKLSNFFCQCLFCTGTFNHFDCKKGGESVCDNSFFEWFLSLFRARVSVSQHSFLCCCLILNHTFISCEQSYLMSVESKHSSAFRNFFLYF